MKYTQNQLTKFSQFFKDNSQLNLPLKLENYSDPIELYKKGHKIRIKKENRGKFTEYCGGNVTDACIQKGKNSPDPKIRKRATFAANARTWNHVQKHGVGGLIKSLRPLLGKVLSVNRAPKSYFNFDKNLLQIWKKRRVISKVNKELKKGIKENSILESYNKVPANKDIGTAYDYLDFLDNIYPNSKLNATFYHGGSKGITKFKTAKELGSTNKGINSGTKDYGIYLADDKSLAQYYAGTHKKANRHLYNVRVNVQNPMRYETNNWYMDKMNTTGDLRFRPGEITQKWYDKLNLKNYDGIYHTKSKNAFDNGELVMFDGNNIHIMGTPKESQMFRKWKQNPQYSSKPLQEEIPITPEQYERSFLNYAKAATPGLIFTGLAATPLAMIQYNKYQKSKVANSRTQKH